MARAADPAVVRPADLAAAPLFESRPVTKPGAFTFGIEGVATGPDGAVFAMNLARQGAVGRLAPDGTLTELAQLPDGGIGNGSRLGPDGALYVADYKRHRVHRLDPRTGARTLLAERRDMHQPNDLAVTDRGTLFASDPDWKKRKGRLWRIDPAGKVELVGEGLGTANGIEISPDGKTLYVSESMQRRIVAYRLDEHDALHDKRVFFTWKDEDVDGIRADADGRLYLARNGKGTVEVVDAAGKRVREITLLGRNPTNLAFGGADGKTVFVSLRDKGWLEAFRVDVPGREWRQQKAWGLVK